MTTLLPFVLAGVCAIGTVAVGTAAIGLVTATTAVAQSNGKISGRVVDASNGEALIGVNIVIDGQPSLGTVTDTEGRYFLLSVPPGTYTVVMSYIGFSNTRFEEVDVSSGRTTELNARLREEAIEGGEVIVVAERPIVIRDRTSSVSFVDREAIEALPVQEVGDLVRYQPGVVSSGEGFHFRGGRTRETGYLVDGIPVNDVFNQGGGSTVDVEVGAVQELQVFTGTFDAELGGAQSGIVSITTRDPGDRLEGSLRLQGAGTAAFSNDVFLGGASWEPLESRDISLSLSGPIRGRRLGFNLNARYEDAVGHLKGERRFTADDAFEIETYRRWYRDVFQPDDTRLIELSDTITPDGDGDTVDMSWSERWTLNPKLVYRPGARTKLTLTALYNNSEGQGYSHERRFAPDNRSTQFGQSLTAIASWQQTFGRSMVLNASVSWKTAESESYAFESIADPRIQFLSASDDVTGISLGATDNSAARSTEEQFLSKADFLWQVNSWNEVKTGFMVRRNRFVIEDLDRSWVFRDNPDSLFITLSFPNGNSFPDLESYRAAIRDRLPVLVPELDRFAVNDRFDQAPVEYAAYVQDKLEFRSQLVVKAGLRYERFNVGEERMIDPRTPTDRIGRSDNFEDTPAKSYLSPRLGISYPISSTGAFRVAYGHFVQMPAYREMFKNPVFAEINVGRLENRSVGNPDLKPERTIKYEMGLQQQLTPFLGMDVNLFYKNIRNLLGVEILGTLDNVQYTRTVNRDYGLVRGGTVAFSLRPVGLLLGAAVDVTWSDARGSSSDPSDVADVLIAGRSGEVGELFIDRQVIPLNWDQRLTANLSANVGKANNWSMGVISQLASGQPYTPAFLDPSVQFPDDEFDNAETKPLVFTFDMTAEKRFAARGLDYALRVQVNNVFNRLNELTVHPVSGRADQIIRLPTVQADRDHVREFTGLFSANEDNARPHWYSAPREILLALTIGF